MKVSFNSVGILQLIFITATLSTSLAFSFPFPLIQKEPPVTPETQNINLLDDGLSKSRSGMFAPLYNHGPAYAVALGIFRDLESKPSCHRAAAASLVFNCSTVEENNGQNDMLKITYAAQLAVCEFEATGIKFPWECQGLNDGTLREITVMNCVKKLEERPQWWTTLSNNIQNAVIMCSAVKHEVDKAEILTLHTNITKTQKSLLSALVISLNSFWESITAQKEFVDTWKRALNEVFGDLAETRGKVMNAMKAAETNAIGIINHFAEEMETRRKESQQTASDFDQFVLRARSEFEKLEERSKTILGVTEGAVGDFSIGASAQLEAIEQNSYLVQQINSMVSFDMVPSIDRLLRTISILSFMIIFASISDSYMELVESHMDLTTSLNRQKEVQEQLLFLLEKAHNSTNAKFEGLSTMMDTLSRSLDATSTKLRALNMNGLGQAGMPVGSVIFISGVLFGRGWEKIMLVPLGLLGQSTVIIMLISVGYIQLKSFMGIFVPKSLMQLSLEVEPFMSESLNSTGRMIFLPVSLTLPGCLIVVTMMISIMFLILGFRYYLKTSMTATKDLS